jgi:hypothetical protein
MRKGEVGEKGRGEKMEEKVGDMFITACVTQKGGEKRWR